MGEMADFLCIELFIRGTVVVRREETCGGPGQEARHLGRVRGRRIHSVPGNNNRLLTPVRTEWAGGSGILFFPHAGSEQVGEGTCFFWLLGWKESKTEAEGMDTSGPGTIDRSA